MARRATSSVCLTNRPGIRNSIHGSSCTTHPHACASGGTAQRGGVTYLSAVPRATPVLRLPPRHPSRPRQLACRSGLVRVSASDCCVLAPAHGWWLATSVQGASTLEVLCETALASRKAATRPMMVLAHSLRMACVRRPSIANIPASIQGIPRCKGHVAHAMAAHGGCTTVCSIHRTTMRTAAACTALRTGTTHRLQCDGRRLSASLRSIGQWRASAPGHMSAIRRLALPHRC